MLLRSLWHAISVLENQYYTKTVDLVTFTEEILNRKLHFLSSAVLKILDIAPIMGIALCKLWDSKKGYFSQLTSNDKISCKAIKTNISNRPLKRAKKYISQFFCFNALIIFKYNYLGL